MNWNQKTMAPIAVFAIFVCLCLQILKTTDLISWLQVWKCLLLTWCHFLTSNFGFEMLNYWNVYFSKNFASILCKKQWNKLKKWLCSYWQQWNLHKSSLSTFNFGTCKLKTWESIANTAIALQTFQNFWNAIKALKPMATSMQVKNWNAWSPKLWLLQFDAC